jgi:prepilin-type N-terminal cleavage/methylation domain-containing protein
MLGRKNNKNKGFTLIELLVVIAIVALLASVAIVAMNSARTDSRNTKRMADLKQIQAALEIYYEEFERYPANGRPNDDNYTELDLDDNDNDISWDSGCYGGSDFITPLSDQGIMVTIPSDPSKGTAFVDCYMYSAAKDLALGNDYNEGYYLAAHLELSAGESAENNCKYSFPNDEYFCLTGGEPVEP